MEKNKVYFIGAPIIVSMICLVLAVNAIIFSTQLNSERTKAIGFNSQIIALEARLSELGRRYDEQARIVEELQDSLDAATKEVEKEIEKSAPESTPKVEAEELAPAAE